MALSHKTFASALRIVASASQLNEPTVRDLLCQAADRIGELLDTIDDYERARLSRLTGMGNPR